MLGAPSVPEEGQRSTARAPPRIVLVLRETVQKVNLAERRKRRKRQQRTKEGDEGYRGRLMLRV
jgi:hypothetical protein